MTAVIRVSLAGFQCTTSRNTAPYQRGLGADKTPPPKKRENLSFIFTSPPLPPSIRHKWVWSLSDVIQLISLRFNYKRKSPSYPSPLDRGSTLPNKLPLVSQESLNYSFYFSFIPLFPSSTPSNPFWSRRPVDWLVCAFAFFGEWQGVGVIYFFMSQTF